MEIENFWKQSPEAKTKKTIPNKFGYWFAMNLPEFFFVGVNLNQIRGAMPKKLFKEWCELNNIFYIDEKTVVQNKKGGKNEETTEQ